MLLFDFEILSGIAVIIVGVISVFITLESKRRISNRDITKYLNLIIIGMIFLLSYSFWHTVREAFDLKTTYGPVIELPEYAFVALTYVLLFIGAIRMSKISKEYGFKTEGQHIKNAVERIDRKKRK